MTRMIRMNGMTGITRMAGKTGITKNDKDMLDD